MKKKFFVATLFVIFVLAFVCWLFIDSNTVMSGENRKLQKRVAELEGYIRAQRYVGGVEMNKYRFPIHPDDYIMPTSPFGERESPFTGKIVEHTGVDLVGVWRARILAAADGVVEEHWPVPGTPVPGSSGKFYQGDPLLGGLVVIRHDDGSKSRYGHLSETRVHTGDRVVAGQLIGRQGATGRAIGPHLHFELEIGGRLVNPLKWVMGASDKIPGETEVSVGG